MELDAQTLKHVQPFIPDGSRTETKLQVIACGLARSGTTSLSHALTRLGFGPIHHFQSLIFDENLSKTWQKAIQARQGGPKVTKEEWDAVFRGFSAAVDVPASYFADELAHVYPEAKVIVNQREFESWFRSYCATIRTYQQRPKVSWFWKMLVPSWQARADMVKLQRRVVGFECASTSTDPKSETEKLYKAHYERMRQEIPADRRLDWTLANGWEPLCAFLGVPVPSEPFPHLNKTDEFTGMVNRSNVLVKYVAWKRILAALRSAFVVVAIGSIAMWMVHGRSSEPYW